MDRKLNSIYKRTMVSRSLVFICFWMESQAGKITFGSEQCGASYVNVMKWWDYSSVIMPLIYGETLSVKSPGWKNIDFTFYPDSHLKLFRDSKWLFERPTSQRPVSNHLVRRVGGNKNSNAATLRPVGANEVLLFCILLEYLVPLLCSAWLHS